ncbi:NAD-dependent epimerase/dehydratase family protein [Caproicibacter sp.]|uniref:NAD-dependent epimerase/dehydratase family protein n=1 Tax=Caproicibacter sp. TaxID=2814884 RepID=UPI00398A009E
MPKVFISGAAGFIGSQLAYRLWKDGAQVVIIDNFSYGQEDNLIFPDHDFRSEILRMDVRDADALYRLFEQENFDYAYHIAAITPLPDCQMNPGEAVSVNVAGTVNVLEAARRFGCRKVIFASTSAVYENDTVFPSKEDRHELPSLIYPTTKYSAECFCKSYAKIYGMNVTCLRFANVYGPHIDCLRKQPPVAGYLIRELFYDRAPVLHSDGKQRRDFVYVDDLIDLALLVQKGDGYDCVNVSTCKSYSINEMYSILAKTMGKEQIKPKYVASSNYWNKYPELYEGKYTISNKALDNEVNKFTQCDNMHALEKYGWKPNTSFEEGLKNTVDFACGLLSKLHR